jgi:hypothetical protein
MSKTLKSKKEKFYYHTGKWEPSKFEEGYVWNCCQSAIKEGGGCNIKIHDPDRMNLASFN